MTIAARAGGEEPADRSRAPGQASGPRGYRLVGGIPGQRNDPAARRVRCSPAQCRIVTAGHYHRAAIAQQPPGDHPADPAAAPGHHIGAAHAGNLSARAAGTPIRRGVPLSAARRAPERVMGITYDTGALIAADRGERRMWARHRTLLARREVPTVPAPVVAQSWRGGGRQVLLARLLAGCQVEVLDDVSAARVTSRRSLPPRAVTLRSTARDSGIC